MRSKYNSKLRANRTGGKHHRSWLLRVKSPSLTLRSEPCSFYAEMRCSDNLTSTTFLSQSSRAESIVIIIESLAHGRKELSKELMASLREIDTGHLFHLAPAAAPEHWPCSPYCYSCLTKNNKYRIPAPSRIWAVLQLSSIAQDGSASPTAIGLERALAFRPGGQEFRE